MRNKAIAGGGMQVKEGGFALFYCLTGDSMVCLYADGNIPTEKRTVCFNSFFAVLNSGRYPG